VDNNSYFLGIFVGFSRYVFSSQECMRLNNNSCVFSGAMRGWIETACCIYDDAMGALMMPSVMHFVIFFLFSLLGSSSVDLARLEWGGVE